MNKKNAFRRGFTLIELMIVIVILGILMGTILPRLTGAQARARDTARKADLTNISQALEVYYGDTGIYPPAPTGSCLNASDVVDADGAGAGTRTVYAALGEYMKGGKVPAAISSQQVTLGCTGAYYYKPLSSGGILQASYVLASDVETWQLANYAVGDAITDLFPAIVALTTDPVGTYFDSSKDADIYIAKMGPLLSDTTGKTTRSIFIVIP